MKPNHLCTIKFRHKKKKSVPKLYGLPKYHEQKIYLLAEIDRTAENKKA